MKLDLLGHRVELDERLLDTEEATVRRQVVAYARGRRREFDFDVSYPDSLVGDVMCVMRSIPFGETRTYGDIADELDTSAVAVGQACGRNPVPIVVPCHRVVGANGLGGFSAAGGTDLKRRLLAHENGESLDAFR